MAQCTEFCQRLRSLEAQHGELPSHDELIKALHLDNDGYLLGTQEELRNRPDCSFCQLVLTACAEAKSPHENDRKADDLAESLSKEPVRVVMFPGEHCLRLSYPSRLGTRLMFVTEDTRKLKPEQGPHSARIVRGRQISPSLVRSWMERCEESHGDTCFHIPPNLDKMEFRRGNISEEGHSNFRLVDVQKRCVSEMPLGTRYVALSYVWGKTPTFRLQRSNFEYLQTEGALDSILQELPRTISDAIAFMSSLEERYLWVDTLCLIQDHQRDMKVGVELMNSIYQGSYLTIVAGSGADAQAGLPGVASESRQTSQHTARLNPTTKLALVHSMDWHLQRTVYNQRGWTFQELVLPRRTLIFINNQVHWRCMEANWREDTAADLLSHWLDPDDSNISRVPESSDGNLSAWWAYQKLFENYSRRQLRYDGDAIRAVSGILRPLGAGLVSWLVEGLPAYYLDVALLFVSSNGKLRRRPEFASYSWAGWSGGVLWPRETHQWLDDSSQNPKNLLRWVQEKTWIRWQVWKRSGSLEDVNCLDRYDGPSRIERFADRHSHLLTDETVAKMKETYVSLSLPLAIYASHSFAFPQPSFSSWKEGCEQTSVAPLYALDLINGQAEFDKLVSQIKNSREWLLIYNWVACRSTKAQGRAKLLDDEGVTSCARDRDELDFEFRDPATSRITGEKPGIDRRLEYAKPWSEELRKKDDPTMPELHPVPETLPRYHLIYFRTISIRLIAGHLPPLGSQRDPVLEASSPHQRVQGVPLLSPSGELMGSLHLDDIDSHTPGTEVECLLMAYSHRPMAGSALPIPQGSPKNGADWNYFWILHVVTVGEVSERRGIGQVMNTALSQACEPGPESKAVLLG
ncbi:hypothetical protein AUP68_13914 [Ilyonectria robusta]